MGQWSRGLSSMQEMIDLKSGISLIRPLLEFKKSQLISIAKKTFGKILDQAIKTRNF